MLPETLNPNSLGALEQRLLLLHKEIGWRMAMKDVLEMASKCKESLPQRYREDLVAYYVAGPQSAEAA